MNQDTSPKSALLSLLDHASAITSESLKAKGWIAVPCESALHFDARTAERIAGAIRSTGNAQVHAICIEQLLNTPGDFMVEATVTDLLAFSRKTAHFSYALAPADGSFAILCSFHDYNLICGRREFVGRCLPEPIPVAQSKFADFATNIDWDPKLREYLTSLSKRYACGDS
jgi:hypothetical protein